MWENTIRNKVLLKGPRPRGISILVILVILSLVFAFASASMATLNRGMGFDKNQNTKLRATYLAQAGLQMALKVLQANDGEVLTFPYFGHIPGHPELEFEVQAEKNEGAVPSVSGDGKFEIPAGQVYLKAYAIMNGKRVKGQFGTAQELAGQADLEYAFALFETDASIDLGGLNTAVLSYDSGPGNIPPYLGNGVPPIANQNGNIRGVNDVFLKENASLWGSAYLPDTAVNFQAYGSYQHSGAVVSMPKPAVPFVFKKPEEYQGVTPVAPPNLGDGDTLAPGCYTETVVFPFGAPTKIYLTSGVYYFERFHFGDGTQVELILTDDEPVRIFFDNTSIIDGLFNMAPGPGSSRRAVGSKPIDIQMFGVDGPVSKGRSYITLDRNSQVKSCLSGGNLVVDFNGAAEYFGTIVAKTIWLDRGTRVHYDEDLISTEPAQESLWVLYNQLPEF